MIRPMTKWGFFILVIMIFATVGNGSLLAGEIGEIKLSDHGLVYRTRASTNAEFIFFRERPIAKILRDGVDIYQVEIFDGNGQRSMLGLAKTDWQPILIEFYDPDGGLTMKKEYHGETAHIYYPAKDEVKKAKFGPEYYDIDLLSYVLRGFTFGNGDKVKFKLAMDGRGGSPIGAFEMNLQEKKREEITVAAGAFDCYQLEMSVGGVAGLFAGKQKFNFWYAADEPHFMVKFEGQEGNMTELVAIEREGR